MQQIIKFWSNFNWELYRKLIDYKNLNDQDMKIRYRVKEETSFFGSKYIPQARHGFFPFLFWGGWYSDPMSKTILEYDDMEDAINFIQALKNKSITKTNVFNLNK